MHNCQWFVRNFRVRAQFNHNCVCMCVNVCFALEKTKTNPFQIHSIFPGIDFALVVIFTLKYHLICTNCCNSITSLIYTVMNAVDGRIFGATCAAKDSARVHIWNGTPNLVFVWKATYNCWCWFIVTWSADKLFEIDDVRWGKTKTEFKKEKTL